MRHLLTLLAALILCFAPTQAQTIKTLGYNTTNGQVVYGGTNILTFTNTVVAPRIELTSSVNTVNLGADWIINEEGSALIDNSSGLLFYRAIRFSTNSYASETRTNLSLGATWLTNTNVTNFRTAIGLGATNDVVFDQLQITTDLIITDGGIISFEDTGEIQFGNAAGPTRAALGLPLPALTNTSNVTFRSAVGVAAAPLFKVLTNDFSITNQTNMTVVDGLTISTEAGKAYIFELFPILTAAFIFTELQIVASNATIYGQWDNIGTGGYGTNALTNINTATVGTDSRIPKQKFYVTTGTNAGSILLQFRSTEATNTNTVQAGSYMTAQEVTATP
jgi:hypothetical protein